MKKPTAEQITHEISELKRIKPLVRQFSAFGDDNHATIDAEIDVLEEGMDDDEVYARWENQDKYEENQHTIDAALSVVNWMNGEEDEAPSLGWEALTKVSGILAADIPNDHKMDWRRLFHKFKK